MRAHSFATRRIIARLGKQQRCCKKMRPHLEKRIRDTGLSVIECTGYKIRHRFKKDNAKYGNDDCTFPCKNAFFS
ncbi:hypothetical protein CJJ12_10630 [Brucella melitensis]|nr:hypothetical protein BFL29_04170 [Brucella canis]AOG46639.1 hypothetical protein BFL32_04200 [Brucella suis]ARX99138.1 hypothetical protein BK201_04780 [Brucella melitensis]AUS57117.1 hypothetical protein C1A46_04720 [Brucella abortus]ARY02314.1 hypothetical protein BK186_04785 [Brucella melitensis]